METKYHINILGRLWMPMCKAASSRTIDAGDGPFQEPIEYDSEMDDLEHYLSVNTGDFSSIIDYQIVRETVVTIPQPNGYKEEHNFKTLHDWESEENELAFQDCMYPEDQQLFEELGG